MVKVPEEVEQIIEQIEAAGFPVYLVGGGMRDMLLGRAPKDWDLATSASADILVDLFPKARAVGVSFGVVQVPAKDFYVDVATFRVDGAYSDYRRPDEVTFTEDLATDLSRRDFTMNALAGHPKKGIVDPFHGEADLRNGLIRTVGEPALRFKEDPLRMLRGIRFAAQLNFDLVPAVFAEMQALADLLEKISAERIREELVKMLVAEHSGKGLRLALETGLIRGILGPACVESMTAREREALRHLAQHLDRTTNALDLRVALVYLCLEQVRGEQALARLKWDKAAEKKILAAFTYLPQLADLADRLGVKQFICTVGLLTYHYLEDLLAQQFIINEREPSQIEADQKRKQEERRRLVQDILAKKEPVFIEELAVHGQELMASGIPEGPEVGKVLHLLLDAVHREPACNNKPDLLERAECLGKMAH